jgi:hypothetical protein
MLRRHDATVAALRDLMMSDRNVVPYVAQFFSGHEEYLDSELAGAFLDWLAAELPEYLERGSEKKHLRLDDVVDLLTKAADNQKSEQPMLQKIGVRLAVTFPDGSFADPLWQIYRRLKTTQELPGEDRDTGIAMQNSELVFGRERAFTALVRATLRNLAWLRSLIESEKENFADVLWLLSNIDTKEGREAWFDLKQSVFEKLPVGSERALLHCLRTARDETEVPRILAILNGSRDDFLTATAFSTLAVIAPDLAIQRLANTDAVNLVPMDACWLFAKRHGFASDPIAELLSAIEAQEAFRTDVLYRELIPTLGPSVAGAFAVRASRAAPDEAWHVELDVWRGLEAMLLDPSADAVRIIRSLLGDAFEASLARA